MANPTPSRGQSLEQPTSDKKEEEEEDRPKKAQPVQPSWLASLQAARAYAQGLTVSSPRPRAPSAGSSAAAAATGTWTSRVTRSVWKGALAPSLRWYTNKTARSEPRRSGDAGPAGADEKNKAPSETKTQRRAPAAAGPDKTVKRQLVGVKQHAPQSTPPRPRGRAAADSTEQVDDSDADSESDTDESCDPLAPNSDLVLCKPLQLQDRSKNSGTPGDTGYYSCACALML